MNAKLRALKDGLPAPPPEYISRINQNASNYVRLGNCLENKELTLLNNTIGIKRPPHLSEKWGDYSDYTKGLDLFGKETGKFRKQNLPAWARWRLQVRFCEWTDPSTGKTIKPSNPDGSSYYPSFDWRPLNVGRNGFYNRGYGQLAYDESVGLKLLINFMCQMDVTKYSIASIYGAMDYDQNLATEGFRNYNDPVCTFSAREIKRFPLLMFDFYYNNGNKARRLNVKETRAYKEKGLVNNGMRDEINRCIRMHNAKYFINDVAA